MNGVLYLTYATGQRVRVGPVLALDLDGPDLHVKIPVRVAEPTAEWARVTFATRPITVAGVQVACRPRATTAG